MPSFVAGSFAVAGAIAAAAPLLIHLLNRRRFRVVPWAAMDLLREAVSRNRRMLQLRDLLLLALRTLCILLFALALARPVISPAAGAGNPNEPVHAVLLVDNSLSMGYQRLSGTLLDEARRRLDGFLERLPLGSRISVVPLCGSSQLDSYDVCRTISDAREALGRIDVVDRSASLATAIDLAAAACAGVPELPTKRVVLIGDQQKINWPTGQLDQVLARAPDLQIVPIVPEEPPANAWIADFHVQDEIANVESPVVFTGNVRYEGPAARQNVEVALLVDGVRVAAQTVDLEPGQSRFVRFSQQLDAPVETGGITFVVATLALATDQLPADDERHLAVPVVSSLPVLFIDQYGAAGEDSQSNRYGETFHLRRLLAPVSSRSDAPRQLVFVRHAAPEQVEREHLEDCRLVVVAGIEAPSHLVPLLREYVEQGGQLLIAAGGRFDPEAWSNAAWLDGAGILPLPLKRDAIGELPDEAAAGLRPFFLSPESMVASQFEIEGASREELDDLYRTPLFFKAAAVDNGDDVLAALYEADLKRIAASRQRRDAKATDREGSQAESISPTGQRNAESDASANPDQKEGSAAAGQSAGQPPHWLIWANAEAGAEADEAAEKLADRQRPKILAAFSNGAPFLVSRAIGRGEVVFASSGVMSGWNNLTRTNAVVLFDRLLHGMLARTLPRRNYGTADRVAVPIAAAERRDTFVLERPMGNRETLFVDTAGDEHFSLSLRRLTERGRYRLTAERPSAEPASGPRETADDSRPKPPQVERLWQIELAVNGPTDESDLRAVNERELRDRFGKAAVRWLSAGEPIQLEGAAVKGRESWKWLMAAALACLLVELALLTFSNAATKVKPAVSPVGAHGASGAWSPTMTGTV